MRNPIVTLIIGLVVGLAIAAGAFFVGMNTGQAQAQDSTQAFFQSRGFDPNAAGGGGAGGNGGNFTGRGGNGTGGGGAAGFVNGTISKVNGNTFTITVPNSADISVTLVDTATIVKTDVGTPADLKEGARVLVRGARSGNNIAANVVQLTDMPGGANLFPGGFGGGGGRNRAGTTPTP